MPAFANPLRTFLMVVYAVGCYVFFFVTFLYLMAFVGDLPVPRTIDVGRAARVGEAVVVDLLLLTLFGLQHSVMARQGFKRWWTRFVPQPVERSTYVLAATLVLALLMWQWRPIASPLVWNVENPTAVLAIQAVSGLGYLVLLVSSYLINHFELFGLRQVFAPLLRDVPAEPEFRTPLFYRHVRHPLYLGFLMGFWATPRMSAGHLLFALGNTAYILVGIWFEERDLVAQFGERYRTYRRQVSMLLPWPRRGLDKAARQP
jgi:protein-S-isoprenylcysteine O-methyltransferase Ste14